LIIHFFTFVLYSKNTLYVFLVARRRGLVVRVKIHVRVVLGLNPGPTVETI
jgi:hypothetical protein